MRYIVIRKSLLLRKQSNIPKYYNLDISIRVFSFCLELYTKTCNGFPSLLGLLNGLLAWCETHSIDTLHDPPLEYFMKFKISNDSFTTFPFHSIEGFR